MKITNFSCNIQLGLLSRWHPNVCLLTVKRFYFGIGMQHGEACKIDR